MAGLVRTEPEIYKAGTREILYSLKSEYQWLDLLKIDGKPYSSLIGIIQRDAQKHEDDTSRNPSIKAIAQELNEPSVRVTKWLNLIYTDLWELNYESPKLFKAAGNRYDLYFKNTLTGQSTFFTLWLDQVLNYNDRFEWSFITAKLGTCCYYVTEISHSFGNGTLTTTASLKSGFYNSYREMLINKGAYLNLISIDEQLFLREYQLDEILKERVEKGNNVHFERSNPRNRFNNR